MTSLVLETSKGASSFILPEKYWKESERNRLNEISSNTWKLPGKKFRISSVILLSAGLKFKLCLTSHTQVHGEDSEIFA